MAYVPSPFGDNILWLMLKPKTITYNKDNFFVMGDQISSSAKDSPIYLVAPESFMDQVSHEWKPLENIATRLLEKASQAKKELKQSTEQHKVDTALLYDDSQRRQISMTVQLGAHSDPQSEIMDIVDYLRKESCPALAQASVKTAVGTPTIFEVKTTPSQLFIIKNAALTSVQPTFFSPFFVGKRGVKGPSKCELTLEFQDIEPLTKERVVPGGGNKVSTSFNVG